MRNWFLAAGAAALAIAVPAAADPGKNESGKGRDRGAQKAQKAERGGGDKGFERAKRAREQRSEFAKKAQEQRFEHAKKAREQRFEQSKKAREQRSEFAKKSREQAFERGKKADERRFEQRKKFAEERSKRFEKRAEREVGLRERGLERRFDDDDRFVRIRDWDDRDRWSRGFATGFVDGCPPGLAKKNNGCLPPGQAKKLIGSVIPTAFRSNVLPLGLRDYWRDDDDHYYRYGDGYVYRVDRDTNLIASLLPLFGGGYGLGQQFPYYNSQSYFVPSFYQPFYPDSQFVDYRYSNGYVYALDPRNGMIEDIIPLYDRGYGVGQLLPASYSYYNLPYPYRDWYTDDASYMYRYAPGAIYQVDPTSSLITAVVSLLAPGLAVGQPLPMGYDVYNVPYAYRDRYYDRSDAWYRYSNGYIYQVDPTTRLVTAALDAIV